MANTNCSACDELRQIDPNLIVNGFGDTECASLQNNTGLSPSSGNDDCEDLNNLNDCLVGNMATEVDAYDVCDWKTFIKKFIPNVWTTLKGIICAICGLWKLAQRIDCVLDYMNSGASFVFDEYSSDTASYIVAGKGISFLNVSASGTAADIAVQYIAGGLAKLRGSLMFYSDNFTDGAACYNYDNNGVNPTKSASRQGNSLWGQTGKLVNGGELLYEVRIKKSEFPQIGAIFEGFGLEGASGAYHIRVIAFPEGQYAFGQHGDCNITTGVPVLPGQDTGHLVPNGWIYLQARMSYVDAMNVSSSGNQYSPVSLFGIRMNQDHIEC